jgi:putative endonuclease
MSFYIYILSNKPKGVLYIGMTNDLSRRIHEHKQKVVAGFSAKYNTTRLVYIEEFNAPHEAIAREKQLKNWRRDWKIDLIESLNKNWNDLYDGMA